MTWKIDDDDAMITNKRADYVPEGESTIEESMQKYKRRPVINAICGIVDESLPFIRYSMTS